MKKLINFPKLILGLWISLWVILFILLVAKLLFHQWYPIIVEHSFTYADTHYWLHFTIATLFYILSNYFICATSANNKHFNLIITLILISVSVGNNVLKYYNNTLGMLVEVLILIVFPIVYNIINKTFKKMIWNLLFPIIINAIIMIWQLNILFIRDINELLKDMPFLISFMMQIDYYIFLIITWIGVVYYMSIWGSWFFERELNKFRRYKAKELKKANPNAEYLAELDERIAYYENKLKEVTA